MKAVNSNNVLVKYADDITLGIPVYRGKADSNEAELEVQSFIKWSEENRININFKKTWELLLRGKTTRIPPDPLATIERKNKLKLLGVTLGYTLGLFTQ